MGFELDELECRWAVRSFGSMTRAKSPGAAAEKAVAVHDELHAEAEEEKPKEL